MSYNQEQQKAILHEGGPAMVLAGPGSGKTTLLIGRMEALIDVFGVRPEEIAVLSFTRAAAAEIRDRFLAHCGTRGSAVTFGTVHAFFLGILLQSGRLIAPRLMPAGLRNGWLKNWLKEQSDPSGVLACASPEEIGEELLRALSLEADLRTYEPQSVPQPFFSEFAERYAIKKREEGYLDFEDILSDCLRFFEEEPAALLAWRKRFRHILVDEFQDINPLQYRLLGRLEGESGQLYVVGDEDQSIYGFRGADAGLMLNFPKDRPGTAIYRLTDCYRCSPEILALASRLICRNQDRFSKTLRSLAGEGPPPHIAMFSSQKEEIEEIGRLIRSWLEAAGQNGSEMPSIGILTRTHYRLAPIAEHLKHLNIPVSPGLAEEKGEGCPCPVSLLTMHGSKGLEFDVVFLPDLIEGVIPYEKAKSKKSVEEERRLLYVAITRARRFLWLGFVKNRRERPSRFLREMKAGEKSVDRRKQKKRGR